MIAAFIVYVTDPYGNLRGQLSSLWSILYGIFPLLLEGKKLESHSRIRNRARADSVAVPDVGGAPTPIAAIFCPPAPHSTFSPGTVPAV